MLKRLCCCRVEWSAKVVDGATRRESWDYTESRYFVLQYWRPLKVPTIATDRLREVHSSSEHKMLALSVNLVKHSIFLQIRFWYPCFYGIPPVWSFESPLKNVLKPSKVSDRQVDVMTTGLNMWMQVIHYSSVRVAPMSGPKCFKDPMG